MKNNMKVKSRKEVRKELRKAKKIKKHESFLKRKAKFKSFNGISNETKDSVNVQRKKNKFGNVVSKSIKKTTPQQKIESSLPKEPYNRIERERQKEKRIREKLERDIEKTRIEKLKADNEKEEIEIKKLEKQMKLKKGKSKAFVLDGLDYLLDVCDKKISQNEFENPFKESDSEFESDYENVVGESYKSNVVNKNLARKKKGMNQIQPQSDSDHEDEDEDSDIIKSDDMDEDYEKAACDEDKDSTGETSSSDLEEEHLYNSRNKLDYKKNTQSVLDKLNKNAKKRSQELIKKDKNYKKVKSIRDSISESSESKDMTFNQEKNIECEDKSQADSNGEKLWEDIYGRTRDSSGNIVNTYLPPHLRIKNQGIIEEPTDTNVKLKRQIKGLLNRLAESNMVYISNQIEELYMNNSRNNMNKTIFSLYQDSLFTKILIPERLISEHAMLIAILHANVGSEVGAFFLQYAVVKLTKALESKLPISDKSVNNLLVFIMHLYNLQLFHCKLMYDIIYLLMKNLEEKEIELILLALRTVGFNLRKNDPIALKNLILKVQEEVNKIQNAEEGSRVKYMLELLTAIKNNNMSKIPNYNPEVIERLRKNLKLFVRKGNFTTELNISLQDLINAEKHGRWWIVGSAWSGPMPQSDIDKSKAQEGTNDIKFSRKLLELAKKQRMNTDVRKNVFCILMSSEDFLEAFEKLIKLKLKGSIEREIMNVLLVCALQEKTFNPYYMHLANKFSKFDRKYQIMLQCAIWDKIKEINDLLPIQVTNLAKFIGSIILEKGLPISVLKVIEFSELDKRTVKFMRQVLLTILLSKDENAVAAVFRRIADSAKLKLFRESLRLFLQHFLLKNTKNVDGKQMTKIIKMVEVCESALTPFD